MAANRRGFLAGTGALALLTTAACGSTGGAQAGADSRTIKHKYGSTTISGRPSRVVTVGLTEQDYVLALGTAPVGVREWFGGHPGALWPWARTTLGSRPLPKVLPVDVLKYEQIAGLKPDLILGVNSGLTKQEYTRLSSLAPTVAQPAEFADYGAPWQNITRIVGTALGQSNAAEGLIRRLLARFADVKRRNPEFAGKTGLLATSIQGDVFAYAEGPAPRFLTELGLSLPPAAAKLFTGKDRKPVQVSLERLDSLESDVLLMGAYGGATAPVRDQAVYRRLRVYRERRDLVMPEMSRLNGALSFGSVLSLPQALDEAVPRIAKLIDGNPATAPAAVA